MENQKLLKIIEENENLMAIKHHILELMQFVDSTIPSGSKTNFYKNLSTLAINVNWNFFNELNQIAYEEDPDYLFIMFKKTLLLLLMDI